MFTVTRLTFSIAIVLATASAASAATNHRVHRHHTTLEQQLPSRVYATWAECSPSKRIDLSRLQPGEMAIMIQSRGNREADGSAFFEGECW
jgi:hypothetical protein